MLRTATQFLSIALLLALLCLSACSTEDSNSRYVVKGLTLPPGATEVSYRTDGTPGQDDHYINVAFNCPGGWDAVFKHFDGCLRRAGYRMVLDHREMMKAASDPDNIYLKSQDWMKSTSGYSVMVEKDIIYPGMKESGYRPEDHGFGEFNLIIIK